MIIESDLLELSFKDINAQVNSITEFEYRNKEKMNNIIQTLKSDNRKNVWNLGKKVENKFNKYNKEENRIKRMYDFDKSFGDNKFIAGVDEVGRGPLAGPIVAAAVILKDITLNQELLIFGLNDSKKLSPEKREYLYDVIKERALCYKVALLDNYVIDKEGVGVCNHNVFLKCCYELEQKPDLVLSDGYAIKGYIGKNEPVIKGDTKSASIAAASILAKVFRDRMMKEYAKVYPQYGFEKNSGYGTQEHIMAIREFGITPIHRKSFLRGLIE